MNSEMQGTGHKILLVDDDTMILKITNRILKREGFDEEDILTAATCDEGIEIIRAMREKILLVMTDFSTPGKTNGNDVAREAESHGVSIIVQMSGDDYDQIKGSRFKTLSKPFEHEEVRALAAQVKMVVKLELELTE